MSEENYLHTSITIENFNALHYTEKLWTKLSPHAEDWWKLLEVNNKKSIELPFIPGLEDIARLLFIAEATEEHIKDAHYLVILPHPIESRRLIKLAQNGPQLIDDLLEPLLNWWDTTKASLSTIEKLLRLKLPDSSQLRLNEEWKSRLEELKETLHPDRINPFILFMDCEGQAMHEIEDHISSLAFYTAIPSHLILSGLNRENIASFQAIYSGGPLHYISDDFDHTKNQINALKSKDTRRPSLISNTTEKTIKIYLPGIKKSDIKIQQIDETVHITYKSHHRTITVSDSLKYHQCSRASVQSGWLCLWFAPS